MTASEGFANRAVGAGLAVAETPRRSALRQVGFAGTGPDPNRREADFLSQCTEIAVRFHLRKTGKKLIHLGNDLCFVGEVQIVVRIPDQDDAGARHAAPERIGPGCTARSVVRN